jgi:hypothetical protein
MSRPLKIILLVIGAAGGLVLAAAVMLPLLIDTNAYKGRFERTASDPLGLEVRVGRLSIALSQHLRITLNDVRVRNTAGAEILTAERSALGSPCPLFRNEVRIKEMTLLDPGSDRAGTTARSPSSGTSRRPLPDLTDEDLARGRCVFLLDSTSVTAEALDLHVRADRLRSLTAAGRPRSEDFGPGEDRL